MTTDFLRFGGAEVVNHERLAAYIANGIRPDDGTRFDVDYCEGLSSVLYPSGAFTTPLGDEAPWYDVDDPDTWDFAGVLALGVTGLDQTTRTVEVIQTTQGNGLPGRAQRAACGAWPVQMAGRKCSEALGGREEQNVAAMLAFG